MTATTDEEILTLRQASEWATEYLGKRVTPSNIAYLINYGRVRKIASNGDTCVSTGDLVKYYESYLGRREVVWKEQLGEDLNWHLSFDHLKEAETTKHVHRLHPYKGKFIPQLVEYFLDDHVDDFKKAAYFHPGDIILDPFCGSGTTLVQANELGMHAVGIDISSFNRLISNVKVQKHDLVALHREIRRITQALREFVAASHIGQFESQLANELADFNNTYFPSPEYKRKVHQGKIDERTYGPEKARVFLARYSELVAEFNIQTKQPSSGSFIDKWYLQSVREEIDFVFERVRHIEDVDVRATAGLILSRTMRSCRATTHSDLGSLLKPIESPYYCSKHGKVCKPLFSMLKWWVRYTSDTLQRLSHFDGLRTATHQICIDGDSRDIDIFAALDNRYPLLAQVARERKISGVFSSPPYVGLIDYHEQHAYAYDLLGFERNDELEIGPLFRGRGREARESYIQGVADVLTNCRRFLTEDYHVFLVANDRFDLYPSIAEKSGMRIVDRFRRPVLNRTERDKSAYAETIFRLIDATTK